MHRVADIATTTAENAGHDVSRTAIDRYTFAIFFQLHQEFLIEEHDLTGTYGVKRLFIL